MSISPSDAQRSSPSASCSLSQNPSSNHGPLHPSQSFLDRPIASGPDASAVGSLQISASEPLSVGNPRCMAAASTDSCGSSKKATGVRNPETKKDTYSRNHGSSSQYQPVGLGGLSSQFKSDQFTSAQLNGKQSGAVTSSHVDQPAVGFNNPHGSNSHLPSRKNQTMNGNHLLNFYYDPISRPQLRMPPPRRPQKMKQKPYNKDLFLQANFKFVVLSSGYSAIESMDPDKMLEWEDVICVRYSTPFPVQCPICLESPVCSQITSCGHIFCFPCILRYLLMGEEDHKGDCWKKCPLCFMMISSKDLYTMYIDPVKQYHVGDHVNFTLLNRPKGSLIPSQKCHQEVGALPYRSDGICDSFSKFTLTSDVELSVREAKMELNDWLAKAESGLVDDMEQLPYVCAALEHLEQRKKCWAEHRSLSGSPPMRSSSVQSSNLKNCKYAASKRESHELSSTTSADAVGSEACEPTQRTPCIVCKDETNGRDNWSLEKLHREDFLTPFPDVPESFDTPEKVSSSYEEGKGFHRRSHGFKDVKEDSYTFYQAIDGQHLILHPLNMKCLLNYYGSYDLLPSRIGGEILQMETVTQSEAMRRRYRFLSHFSLTTTFQLCEIDLSDILPPEALSPFIDEIKKREKQRKRVAKKENDEKAKAEAAAAAFHSTPIPSDFRHCSCNDATFSIDDFEALGSSSVSSTSPPVTGERKLFSDVTRLGFAAAHDSPSLKADESIDALSTLEMTGESSRLTGPRTAPTMSFANIISTAKPEGGTQIPKMNDVGKKGKKPSRVLLSTAGGRRY